MEKVVTIPYGYEELAPPEQAQIVPICIARYDVEGREVAQGWFDAVSEIQDRLRSLVQCVVRDVWRTSEVVEPAVHSLSRVHGDRLGRSPAGQVYVASRWRAKRVRKEDLGLATRTRRIVVFDTLDAAFRREVADPTNYESMYHMELDLAEMDRQFQARGLEDVSMMYKLVRDGLTWNEVGERMNRDPHTAQRRFRRWRDRIARCFSGSSDTLGDPV